MTLATNSTLPDPSTLHLNQPDTKADPATYKGLYAFHKYWGKKPVELVSYLIENLSAPGDLVIDPFLGSGAIARESLRLNRRFAGCDLNPSSVELSRLTCELPTAQEYASAITHIETRLAPLVQKLYELEDGGVGSHYLWDGEVLRTIWTYPVTKKRRVELKPSAFDFEVISRYKGYETTDLRRLCTYANSRINAVQGMDWHDFFTDRALIVIESIVREARAIENPRLRRAVILTLTSSLGQMSRMVFALEKRGTGGRAAANRVEVGSWAIGFWRPRTHFEVNAWNCFEVRAKKFLSAVKKMSPEDLTVANTTRLGDQSIDTSDHLSIDLMDARTWLTHLPDRSVELIITDPPHSDRIPYMELSELWNAVLGIEPQFEDELVISNAAERSKSTDLYFRELEEILHLAERKLSDGGNLALMYNSSSDDDWAMLRKILRSAGWRFEGVIPAKYSVGSLVQDNRTGALKADMVVVASKLAGPPSVRARSIIKANEAQSDSKDATHAQL